MAISTSVFAIILFFIFVLFTGPLLGFASIAFFAIGVTDALGDSVVVESDYDESSDGDMEEGADTSDKKTGDIITWKVYMFPVTVALIALAPVVTMIVLKAKGDI